ncbi:hypothetical protein EV122DRAFT_285020 [Schizophyllum commune]
MNPHFALTLIGEDLPIEFTRLSDGTCWTSVGYFEDMTPVDFTQIDLDDRLLDPSQRRRHDGPDWPDYNCLWKGRIPITQRPPVDVLRPVLAGPSSRECTCQNSSEEVLLTSYFKNRFSLAANGAWNAFNELASAFPALLTRTMGAQQGGFAPEPWSNWLLDSSYPSRDAAHANIKELAESVLSNIGFISLISGNCSGWELALTQETLNFVQSLQLDRRDVRGYLLDLRRDWRAFDLKLLAQQRVPFHYFWTPDMNEDPRFASANPDYVELLVQHRDTPSIPRSLPPLDDAYDSLFQAVSKDLNIVAAGLEDEGREVVVQLREDWFPLEVVDMDALKSAAAGYETGRPRMIQGESDIAWVVAWRAPGGRGLDFETYPDDDAIAIAQLPPPLVANSLASGRELWKLTLAPTPKDLDLPTSGRPTLTRLLASSFQPEPGQVALERENSVGPRSGEGSEEESDDITLLQSERGRLREREAARMPLRERRSASPRSSRGVSDRAEPQILKEADPSARGRLILARRSREYEEALRVLADELATLRFKTTPQDAVPDLRAKVAEIPWSTEVVHDALIVPRGAQNEVRYYALGADGRTYRSIGGLLCRFMGTGTSFGLALPTSYHPRPGLTPAEAEQPVKKHAFGRLEFKDHQTLYERWREGLDHLTDKPHAGAFPLLGGVPCFVLRHMLWDKVKAMVGKGPCEETRIRSGGTRVYPGGGVTAFYDEPGPEEIDWFYVRVEVEDNSKTPSKCIKYAFPPETALSSLDSPRYGEWTQLEEDLCLEILDSLRQGRAQLKTEKNWKKFMRQRVWLAARADAQFDFQIRNALSIPSAVRWAKYLNRLHDVREGGVRRVASLLDTLSPKHMYVE